MYEVTVKTGFSAAHRLRLYDGKYENLHGHNWSAQVSVEADELDAMGVGIDFVRLKKFVEEILGELDYQNINEIPPFDKQNPSAENGRRGRASWRLYTRSLWRPKGSTGVRAEKPKPGQKRSGPPAQRV